uniref:Uncharacterized protein n=1 Tax=viral metagenome TaxID=1070528 RepID=A0A6C0BDZ6_9ZZZZ
MSCCKTNSKTNCREMMVCRNGQNGQKGEKGDKGDKGDNGGGFNQYISYYGNYIQVLMDIGSHKKIYFGAKQINNGIDGYPDNDPSSYTTFTINNTGIYLINGSITVFITEQQQSNYAEGVINIIINDNLPVQISSITNLGNTFNAGIVLTFNINMIYNFNTGDNFYFMYTNMIANSFYQTPIVSIYQIN